MYSSFHSTTFLGHDFEFFNNDLRGLKARQGATAEEEIFQILTPVLERISGGGTCLDVGANIGLHTSFFANFFDMVYCFEPNPHVFAALSGNILRNGLKAKAVNAGLSDEEAKLVFYIHQENFGRSSFCPQMMKKEKASRIEASVLRGDLYVARKKITDIRYIKIDVEGYEPRVIKGLEKTIARDRPLISIEWNNDLTRKEFRENNLLGTVLAGYVPVAAYAAGRLTSFYWGCDYDIVLLLPEEMGSLFA